MVPEEIDNLAIICYPDPRLSQRAEPVTEFDGRLRRLAEKMIELMVAGRGIGLAAPQVGVGLRLFVASPTASKQDARIYVNPVLSELRGKIQSEAGCLSIPGVTVKVVRAASATITAQDLEGNNFAETDNEFLFRVWQHEYDHLDGILLTDKMNRVSRIANRRQLRYLEQLYAEQRAYSR